MTMEHDDALELIEIAAAEPAGIDRLMAGDTPEAARLAGHLAECAACGQELVRIRRLAAIVREMVLDLPAPELRERTLARVAAVGRLAPTAGSLAGPAEANAGGPPTPAPAVAPDITATGPSAVAGADATAAPAEATPTALPAARARRRPPAALRTVASVAAVLIAVVGTGIIVSAQRDAEFADQAAAIARADQAVAALAKVSAWSMRVGAEPDASRVVLAGAPGEAARGTIVFAPTTLDLVVVVSDLAEPPPGQEYRCWVDVASGREPVGRMFFGGGLAYWVGPVDALAEVTPGTLFGISLVDANGSSLSDGPVLTGRF